MRRRSSVGGDEAFFFLWAWLLMFIALSSAHRSGSDGTARFFPQSNTEPNHITHQDISTFYAILSSTGLWLRLRRGVFTCVGWKVTLCDPIWQVTPRSSEVEVR